MQICNDYPGEMSTNVKINHQKRLVSNVFKTQRSNFTVLSPPPHHLTNVDFFMATRI